MIPAPSSPSGGGAPGAPSKDGAADLIREAVQSRLESLGMSAAELARISGVHPVVLYRWLSGSRSISLANAERVLLALDLVIRPPVIT